MCAIAGILDLTFDPKTIERMIASMRRRGPDDTGAYLKKNCCLLHSRLAIIDPDGGKQPMKLSLEGETYTIVYNGELYNTEELREELQSIGHIFDGHSDTEVVLHAYAQWNEEALLKMNGIFAFAVWHNNAKMLFLARDRMGVKPLFYTRHNGGLLFASEIKTLLAYPTVQAQLDTEGILQLIMLGPGRIPGSGVLREIEELEPGCCGIYRKGKWSWKRYWSVQDREHTASFEETAETVECLVADAIRRQMVSDVPIGTFLSGGLDSSLITAVCAEEMRKKGEQLSTFSVDYENNSRYFTPGKFQPESDNAYIDIMRNALNTKHCWTVLNPDDLLNALEAATAARDLPGMADVDISLLCFCRQIRKDVKVALSGECADEIFGGYPWYRDPEIRAFEGFPWAQNTKFRATFLLPEHSQRVNACDFVMDHYRKTINEADVLPGTPPEERRMKEMVSLNQRWFMQTLLDRKDRMSMYSGLEVRVPFCDYRIAEYLYAVPWEYKDYMGKEKGLLRYAMRQWLPKEVLYRKKSPYPKTHDPRYLQLVSAQLRQILEDNNAPLFQIVRKESVQSVLTTDQLWPWYGQLMKTPQLIAFLLQLNCWLDMYHVTVV